MTFSRPRTIIAQRGSLTLRPFNEVPAVVREYASQLLPGRLLWAHHLFGDLRDQVVEDTVMARSVVATVTYHLVFHSKYSSSQECSVVMLAITTALSQKNQSILSIVPTGHVDLGNRLSV